MRYITLLALGLGLTLLARADFAPVPLDKLVKDAAAVVEGKVIKIDNGVLNRGVRQFDAAVVQVKSVLKGDPKLKEVRIAQPGVGGLAVSTDIRFQVGQEGIWILTKQADAKGKDAEFFWALHPSQFQPLTERDKLTRTVKGN